MTEKNHEESYTLWQEAGEDSVSEKPLIVSSYSDVICISQEGREINVNYESVNELCKLLKKLKHS